jgi:ribosomal protein S18 acetylase RimI-like enzyme
MAINVFMTSSSGQATQSLATTPIVSTADSVRLAHVDIRRAGADDSGLIGQLLHDFNTEFEEPTPPAAILARRVAGLPHTAVLLAEDVGLVVLRFQPSLWTENLECYLAELYVRPAHRGQGIGEALLTAAVDHARAQGADYIHLGTTEDDVAARHLYAKSGFRRTEGDGGPLMFVYEMDLR